MKHLILIMLIISKMAVNATENNATKIKKKKNLSPKVVVTNEKEQKTEKPCDSKEDLLKKLEEKKKAQAAVEKAFSLQGGNTGCSVK